jgi:hypothetical protein
MPRSKRSLLLALTTVALAAALSACDPSVDNDDVSLTAQDSDACSDLSCPVAAGTRDDLFLRVRPGSSLVQSTLVISSSDETVVQVTPGHLTDSLLSWEMHALAPGHADLIVRDAAGHELRRAPLDVEPTHHFTLRFAFGFSDPEPFDDAQVKGPVAAPGYDEQWTIASGTAVSFGITSHNADGAEQMGTFDFTFAAPAGVTIQDPAGLAFIDLTASAPGAYPVDVISNRPGLEGHFLFVVE